MLIPPVPTRSLIPARSPAMLGLLTLLWLAACATPATIAAGQWVQAPVVSFHPHGSGDPWLHVGADVASETRGTGQVAAYLVDDAGADGHVRRFGAKPPTVRVIAGAAPDMFLDVVMAVRLVNASLPDNWQLRFDPRPGAARSGQPRYREILVAFQPHGQWPAGLSAGPKARGLAERWFRPDNGVILSGRIWIDTGPRALIDAQPRLFIIVHEILHTLGRNHPRASFSTVMNSPPRGAPGHVLHPLDREALTATYGWLEPGTPASRIAAVLAKWSEYPVRLADRLQLPEGPCRLAAGCAAAPAVSFGVAARNGLTQPWATGPRPRTSLRDSALSETVRWAGRVLGFTPGGEPVAGTAVLTVDMATLDARLLLDGLETGAGHPWGRGRLEYAVTVRGNTFAQTRGDEGVVTGAFLSPGHELAGGVLKRHDLTAAWGGKR